MPIGWIAAAGSLASAAGSIIGGSEISGASKDASKLIGSQYQDIANKLLPFLQRGTTASSVLGDYFGINNKGDFNPDAPFLKNISSVIGAPPSPNDASLKTSFQSSPGYQYLIDQMKDTVQNSAAGKTGAVSGNMLKALQTNAAGIADQDWNSYYNKLVQNYGLRYGDTSDTYNRIINGLTSISGSGQSAATTTGQFGQTAAQNQGSLGLYGTLASVSGLQGGLNSLSGNSDIKSLLTKLLSGSGGSSYGDWSTGSYT